MDPSGDSKRITQSERSGLIESTQADKMHDQSSIESSLGEDHHHKEIDLHRLYFDFDSDCTSIESSRCGWKKSSGAQCDVSVESPWCLFREQDLLGHFFSNHASDEEHEENDSHHRDNDNNMSNAVHEVLSIERRLPFTIESKSSVHTADTRERNRRVLSLGATNCFLHESDSFTFRRLSSRKSDEPGSKNKDQRSSGKKSPSKLNRLLPAKEHIPQFAVIEWDEEMLKRTVDTGIDSSSECD